MNCGHLFNGIGGFALSASWMGWSNIFHCEIDPFCNKVMKKHFPNSIEHGDIKTTDFTLYRGIIDLLTGGFPCQPFSDAGKKGGSNDNRHLWPEMLRAIREIQPLWIVGENVPGIVTTERGMVFRQIQTDLASEGYKVLPTILPACSVNAKHRRDRIWFIAHSGSFGQQRGKQRMQTTQEERSYTSDSAYGSLQRGRIGNNLPTSRIFRGTNGVSNGLDRIKSLGNSIVPQVAYQIFKAIQEYDIISKTQ